jgi:predicted membrane-bound mannosyltransferase
VLERRAAAIAVILVLAASFRVAGTWWVYSHTSDEPAHISCGMQWLDRGVYRYEPQHPPLARAFTAIGPYLLGARSETGSGTLTMNADGIHIL